MKKDSIVGRGTECPDCLGLGQGPSPDPGGMGFRAHSELIIVICMRHREVKELAQVHTASKGRARIQTQAI